LAKNTIKCHSPPPNKKNNDPKINNINGIDLINKMISGDCPDAVSIIMAFIIGNMDTKIIKNIKKNKNPENVNWPFFFIFKKYLFLSLFFY